MKMKQWYPALIENVTVGAGSGDSSSGVAFDVNNPDLVVLMKSQLVIASPRSDRFNIVPLFHVAGVEVIGNGHNRRQGRSK